MKTLTLAILAVGAGLLLLGGQRSASGGDAYPSAVYSTEPVPELQTVQADKLAPTVVATSDFNVIAKQYGITNFITSGNYPDTWSASDFANYVANNFGGRSFTLGANSTWTSDIPVPVSPLSGETNIYTIGSQFRQIGYGGRL